MASFSVDTVFKAIDKMSAPMRRMEKSVGGLQNRVQVAEAKMSRGFRNIQNTVGGLGLTLGAVFGGRELFRTIADFETGLVGVGKTTGIAGKDLQKLGVDVISLSKRLEVVSNETLLGFAQNAGQLGVTGSENILKFAETMAKLETASDVAGEEGASAIARLLTITGEGVGVVDQFSSALVELGNNTAATENEILGVASEVGRAIAPFRVASSEILGISAAFKALDVRPEAAGTAVGKAFRAIEGAVNNGGKELQGFSKIMNVSSDEVSKLFAEDRTKAFQTFVSGLGKINESGGSVSDALTSVGLNGEIVSKAFGPMATNAELLNTKINESVAAFEKNVALQEEFETASKTLNNAVKSITIGFSNFINTAANSESTSALGIVRDTLFSIGRNMDIIIPILTTLVGLFLAYKAIVLITTTVMAAYNTVQAISLALQGKTLLFLKGNTAAMVGFKIITAAVTAATWLWTGAQTAINALIAANPIGALILAIGILIGLIVLAVKNFDDFGSILLFILGPIGMIINAFMLMKKNWQSITDAFKGEGIIAGLKRIGLVLLDTLLYPLQQALELASNIPGVGDLAAAGAERIVQLRERLELVNPEQERQIASEERQREQGASSTLDVTVRDESGRADINSTGPIVPNLTPTFQS